MFRRTRIHRAGSLGLTAAMIIVIGCNDPHAPKGARVDRLSPEEPDYPKIVILGGLDKAVVCSDVIVEQGPPLHVTVLLRNDDDDARRSIQYRFLFLDAAGRRLNADPDWHFKHMDPRVHLEVSGNALDAHAADWRLEVRPAR